MKHDDFNEELAARFNSLVQVYDGLTKFLHLDDDILHNHPGRKAWKEMQKGYSEDKRNFKWFRSANFIADVAFGTSEKLGYYLVVEIKAGDEKVTSVQLTTREDIDGFETALDPIEFSELVCHHILTPLEHKEVLCRKEDSVLADFQLKYWYFLMSQGLHSAMVIPFMEKMLIELKDSGILPSLMEWAEKGTKPDFNKFGSPHESLMSRGNIEHMLTVCHITIELMGLYVAHSAGWVENQEAMETFRFFGTDPDTLNALTKKYELLQEYFVEELH